MIELFQEVFEDIQFTEYENDVHADFEIEGFIVHIAISNNEKFVIDLWIPDVRIAHLVGDQHTFKSRLVDLQHIVMDIGCWCEKLDNLLKKSIVCQK
jgi:hypothetical protein